MEMGKGRTISYTARQLAFIKRRRKKPRDTLHAEFVRRFRRRDVSIDNIKKLCVRNGWKGGSRGFRKGHSLAYSRAELAFIKRRRKRPRRELHAEFVERFGREVTLKTLNQLCERRGWLTGRDGRYPKGSVPANKGKKMPYNANSARTQFKKGQLPRNTKQLGHERVDRDGYVLISVAEKNPHTGYERRYVFKHRWLWQKQFGPVPPGMVLKCKGDKLNTDPSNWQLVPRGVLARLNKRWRGTYDQAPGELRPSMMQVAELEHRLGEARRRSVRTLGRSWSYPIPHEALDDRLGWTGTSGTGKTYDSGTAIERVLHAKSRVCIVDPLGVWWGLRLAADGKSGRLQGRDLRRPARRHRDHRDVGQADRRDGRRTGKLHRRLSASSTPTRRSAASCSRSCRALRRAEGRSSAPGARRSRHVGAAAHHGQGRRRHPAAPQRAEDRAPRPREGLHPVADHAAAGRDLEIDPEHDGRHGAAPGASRRRTSRP
jgi:hypothetical protein